MFFISIYFLQVDLYLCFRGNTLYILGSMSNFYNYILASVSFSEVCFFYFHHSDNFLLVGSIFKWENIFSFDVSSFYSVEHDIQTQNLSNYKL